MIYQENQTGAVSVANNVYTEIAGIAASNCFGVKGMVARSVKDGLFHLLRKEAMGKGVKVEMHEDNTVSIDVHIMVDSGVNMNAVGSSIISEVRYKVQSLTNTEVRDVNVFIDALA